MKQVNEMPAEGQFVAVWMFGDAVWSGIFENKDGVLFEYMNDADDSWEATGDYFNGDKFTEQKFFVKD